MGENVVKRKKTRTLKKSLRRSAKKSVKKSVSKPAVHPHCFICKKSVTLKKYTIKKVAGTAAKSASGSCPHCGEKISAFLEAAS